MKPPDGIVEIKKLYGDPTRFVRDDGTVSALWEARTTVVPFPAPLPLGWNRAQYAKGARVNVAIAEETAAAFAELAEKDLWRKFRTYDGGYAWRVQRGATGILSTHAFAGALDFDEDTNKLGHLGDMDPGVVAVLEARGWTWGGRFRRPDWMHFQWARGY